MEVSEERLVLRHLRTAFDRWRGDVAKKSVTVIWAIGKSEPWVGVPAILDILMSGPELTEDELYQALVAANPKLEFERDDSRFLEVLAKMRDDRLTDVLRNIIRGDWQDERIMREARITLKSIEERTAN